MSYKDLNLESRKSTKRVGRGIAAGQGKTAGRGTKGQKSRAGFSLSPGFEGGQNPMMQMFPKLRGFRSFKTKAELLFTGSLDKLPLNIDNLTLAEAGLISSAHVTVKLISKGEVKNKHNVSIQSASSSAIKALNKAGGTFKKVPRVGRVKKVTDKKS